MCVMVIVWRLRGNIIRTALCWIVWHNVHSQQHCYMRSSYRSNRLGLSHWDPYAVRRGGCLDLLYCNMVEWFWWDSSLISTTSWFPSVLWHCWFGHLACKNRPRNELLCVECDVKPYTLTHSPLPLYAHCIQHHYLRMNIRRLPPTFCVWPTIALYIVAKHENSGMLHVPKVVIPLWTHCYYYTSNQFSWNYSRLSGDLSWMESILLYSPPECSTYFTL